MISKKLRLVLAEIKIKQQLKLDSKNELNIYDWFFICTSIENSTLYEKDILLTLSEEFVNLYDKVPKRFREHKNWIIQGWDNGSWFTHSNTKDSLEIRLKLIDYFLKQ